MTRRSPSWFLTLSGLLVLGGVWLTRPAHAGDNLDYEYNGQIRDMFWDSRLYSGTGGFPSAISWHHNATGIPGLNQAEFETRIQTAFNTWQSVDDGIPGEPLIPVVNFGGQTTVTDAFALDGVNALVWKAGEPGNTLAVTPCWVLTSPTTTIDGGSENTVLPIDGGSSIPFPGPIGVTYPAGAIIDCGMQFDSLDDWSTSEVPDPAKFDVQAIATHEEGHFIGISHSTLGDFSGAGTISATMLPFGAPGDATFRTLEQDDKASALRTYTRNRAPTPISQTAGNRGVIRFNLFQGTGCAAATGLSVVAYPTSTGISGPNKIETFSGSQLRAGLLDEPYNGSVTLNVPPLAGGDSYRIYARTLESGSGALSAQRYNYTTIQSNLIDPENQSRVFDSLATVNAISAGQTIDLGAIGILGCWPPVPTSQIDLTAVSITAPTTATKGNQIAVTSSFHNQGTVASGAFEVGVYFSTDAAIDTSDKFTGFTCSIPGLPAGGTGTCNGNVNVPNVVPGNYYVGLLVDRLNQVGENLETNNGVAASNLTAVAPNPLDPIVNGSFETGDLTGWSVKELTSASNPSLPLSVHGAGVEYPAPQFFVCDFISYCGYLDYFTSAPTDGQYAVLHDFNGNDPTTNGPNAFINRRELYQDLTLPAGTTTLEFDYRAAWELFRFGSTQDRTFDVEIEPAGGGATLLDQTILHAWNGGFEEDTDHPSGGSGSYPPGIVNLSAFAGQNVRLKFVWNIPEPGTGFGFFQLDNIRLNTAPIAKTDTSTTIASHTPSTTVTGQAYSVSVTVSPVGGSGTPSGNVTVSDGAGASCNALLAGGSGSCSLTANTAIARTLTAVYAGDAAFNGSTSATANHGVSKAGTTTTITSDSPDPSNVGQAYTVAFAVAASAPGAGTPTGTVAVNDGAGGSCSAAVAAGSCSLTSITGGAKTLTATYAGDSNFTSSSDTEAHQVNTTETIPVAPSNLTAVKVLVQQGKRTSLDRIDLSWTDNSTNETSFPIERWKLTGKGKNQTCALETTLTGQAHAGTGAASYSDTSASNSTCKYRVAASNSAGTSAYIEVIP